MGKIFVTSDLHFGHDRGFLYEPRGFKNIEDHDETVIANWNNVVSDEDDVYVLGDLMLNDNEHGVECIKKLKGKIHIIYGNHDTDARKKFYDELGVVHGWADVIKYRKYNFYLSHFPTMTGNLEAESLHQCTLNIAGHTHSKDEFREDVPMYFNAAADANNNTPVLLDDVIEKMKEKAKECLSYL